MKVLRSTVSLATGLLLVPLLATAAAAAPAPNDTAASATAVTSLPTTITQDTSEATTDALDASLNELCGAPFTNASVWFTYTDPDGGGVVADMSESSYSGGFIVTEGDPNDGNVIACGPTTVGFSTAPGGTYYVVAFSDTEVNGGELTVTFDEAPPAPEVAVSVDPTATAYRDGSALLTGTYSCSDAIGEFSDIEGTMVQTVGRFKVTGYFFVSPLECDGTTRTWEALVVSDTGLFRGGKAATVTFAFACGVFECSVGYSEDTVKVTSSRKR